MGRCSDRVSEDKPPFFVQACPVDALDFGLHEDMSVKARKRADDVAGYLYGDKEAEKSKEQSKLD